MTDDKLERVASVDIGRLRRKRMAEQTVGALVAGKNMVPDLQLVVMADITGSMYKYFDEVRQKFAEIVAAVKKEVPRSQFAVFAYRNHGDEDRYDQIFYASPLSSDEEAVAKFIRDIKRGGGGSDALTCMEDCLREANGLTWQSKAQKAIVIVGDMPPHGVLDSLDKCYRGIDYRAEISALKNNGVRIYPVFCGDNQRVKDFYQSMAVQTGGRLMDLAHIGEIVTLLVAVCMKETGKLDKFLADLRAQKQLSPGQERIIKALL